MNNQNILKFYNQLWYWTTKGDPPYDKDNTKMLYLFLAINGNMMYRLNTNNSQWNNFKKLITQDILYSVHFRQDEFKFVDFYNMKECWGWMDTYPVCLKITCFNPVNYYSELCHKHQIIQEQILNILEKFINIHLSRFILNFMNNT